MTQGVQYLNNANSMRSLLPGLMVTSATVSVGETLAHQTYSINQLSKQIDKTKIIQRTTRNFQQRTRITNKLTK